jgi:methionyl-tRNA formyltransferase
MEAGLDTGPVYAARPTPIGADEDAGELAARLARLGAELLIEVVASLEADRAIAVAQPDAGATYAPKLAGVRTLDLALPADELARRVRAYNPEPGTTLAAARETIKVLRARAMAGDGSPPGTVVATTAEGVVVAAGDSSALELARVQRPGGRPVSGRELANGLRLRPGDRFA